MKPAAPSSAFCCTPAPKVGEERAEYMMRLLGDCERALDAAAMRVDPVLRKELFVLRGGVSVAIERFERDFIVAPVRAAGSESAGHVSRVSYLTEADIALIAEDVCAVTWWCMRERIKRPDQVEQVKRAIEARLGRRPLVIAGRAA